MAREAQTSRQAGVQFAWPTNDDGAPLTLLTFQASELIGLPEYSNVTVGPAAITTFVDLETEPPTDGVLQDRAKSWLRYLAQAVEESVAEERAVVHAALQGG
jgi:hypothetical protein